MLEILHEAFDQLHQHGGKPLTKLQVEDKLLLTLQYWREYRFMEHFAHNPVFRLPGKRTLLAEGEKPQTIIIDVTESPIERPKKSKKSIIPARKSVIR